MKHLFRLVPLLTLFSVFLVSCSKDPSNPIDRTYSNNDFNVVEAGEQFRFTFTPGPAFSIRASGEERDISDLVLANVSNKLLVEYRNFKLNRKIVRFVITMPSLEGVILSGQAQAQINGFVETAPVSFYASGQSAVWANINAPRFILDATGQSKIEFQGGAATSLQIDASGQSTVNTYSMQPVVSAAAVATGQSTIKIKVGNQLFANATGQSRIFYQGDPPVKNISETGQARVIKE
jgi:hypothetical protein